MNRLVRLGLLLGVNTAVWINSSPAIVIDFTGGTVVRRDGSTQTTNNSAFWDSVDYYIENGFKLDFVFDPPPPPPAPPGPPGPPPPGPPPPAPIGPAWSSFIGDYYHVGNDVIHGHWTGGGPTPSDLAAIEITKVGGGTFDLNYFILTSNTHNGPPGVATGAELTYIQAIGGSYDGYTQLLPPETWGFPATQVYLGQQFDAVTAVRFFTTNAVECFGMDEFYIDEAPPRHVPDSGGVAAMLSLSLGGLAWLKRQHRSRRRLSSPPE